MGAALLRSSWASHWGGLFEGGAQALGTLASVDGACGLSSSSLRALECRLSSCDSVVSTKLMGLVAQ